MPQPIGPLRHFIHTSREPGKLSRTQNKALRGKKKQKSFRLLLQSRLCWFSLGGLSHYRGNFVHLTKDFCRSNWNLEIIVRN
jgi:hypothetical protein